MGRLSRPSPFPDGEELGGGADNGHGETVGGCPTVKCPRTKAVVRRLKKQLLEVEQIPGLYGDKI